MSTAWGLRCNTCCVDSPDWFTNAQGAVYEAVKFWPELVHVKALQGKLSWFDLTCEPICYQRREDDQPTIFDFLTTHYGHDLMYLNEYGHTRPLDVEGYPDQQFIAQHPPINQPKPT